MSGIFGEGIDLRGERLVGSLVVGVGLPQICLERDLVRGFFDRKAGDEETMDNRDKHECYKKKQGQDQPQMNADKRGSGTNETGSGNFRPPEV